MSSGKVLAPDEFSGFTNDTLDFFYGLMQNNSKQWFDDNREAYDKFVIAPARSLVLAFGDRLKTIAPEIVAEPKVNRSLFRINRDVRFSKDKTPYKTNLGVWMWEGIGKRMESSGFYFHIEPPRMLIGVGMKGFSKELMARYRASFKDEKKAMKLVRIVDKLKKQGYDIGGLRYKRVPKGYSEDLPYAELLKYDGMVAFKESL